MVTPVILTYNEEENIGTTLGALSWASRIVVLDSGSTDRTEEIARSFKNVSWFQRQFDTHSAQWRAAIEDTCISTPHVLALDADMRPGPGFEGELETFLSQHPAASALIPFQYRMVGQTLAGSIYPAQTRLFRKESVRVEQTGHTQTFIAPAPLYKFRAPLIHEDNKPVGRWLQNQVKYAALEAERIRRVGRKGLKDWLRIIGVSPIIWGAYAYVKAGGPLNARASRAYACERLVFEAILSRLLMDPSSQQRE